MKLEIKLDPACAEPVLTLRAAAMTEELERLVRQLAEPAAPLLCGERAGRLEVLEPGRLLRVYAAAGRVYAETDRGEYLLRMRLYEAEARLAGRRFVRISHSEMVNLDRVESFDTRLTGTICVRLENGGVSYVSRRYVPAIKQILGI